ncbi:hypothetical protein ACSQ67_010464 [Phaseolus vulgaris]
MALSDLDKAVMVVFDQLPHKLPTREIISLYASSDPRADFIEIMSRADASLHEYMNKLRRAGDGRSASIGTAGPLAAVLATTVHCGGRFGCCKEKGSASGGSREGRVGPSRTARSQRRWRSA